MVQFTGLKKLNPLFPIISVIVLIVVFIVIFFQPIREKLFNVYPAYISQRSELVDRYNYNITKIKEVNLDTKDISKYLTNLNRIKSLTLEQISILESVINLNEKYSKEIKDQDVINEIALNSHTDNQRFTRMSILRNKVVEKIDAINVYNVINNFDTCLKDNVKNDLSKCSSISKNIVSPAIISEDYTNAVSTLLTNYKKMSISNRNKQINVIVGHLNSMTKGLNSIINSSLVIQ